MFSRRTQLIICFIGANIFAQLLAPPVIRADAIDADADWQLSLRSAYEFGKVDGFVQTPSGGEPATTSRRRPTLSEIGIDDVSLFDARIAAALNTHEIFASAQITRMSGSATLDQSLIGQANLFPAGTHVSSELKLDWYQIGYRHRFDLARAEQGRRRLALYPSIAAAFFDFDYALHGGGSAANRHYIKVTPQFGLELDCRPGAGPFWLALQLEGSAPFSPPLPLLFVEKLTANYAIVSRRRLELSVFAGVAFEQMDFEDSQTVPNRVSVDLGPLAVFGLAVKF